MNARSSTPFASLYGSAGKITVRRNPGHKTALTLYARQNPAQPSTPAQLLAQARMTNLYIAYAQLTPSGRVQYILEAAKLRCTPFNAFLKSNWLLPPALTGLTITQVISTANATFSWTDLTGPMIPSTDNLTLVGTITAHSPTTAWNTSPSYQTPPLLIPGTHQPYPANLTNIPGDCDELQINAHWETFDGLHIGQTASATCAFTPPSQALPAPVFVSLTHT